MALASLVGGMVFPLSRFGAWSPASDAGWALLLSGAWAALAGWAILFAVLLRRYVGLSRERALYWAALCHVPLLLALGLVAAVQGGPSGQAYASSSVGRQLFQPLARDFVLAAPLAGQILVLAACRWRALLPALPVLGLLLLSIGLRFSHAAWGLPALFHPDEHRYIGPATMMVARGDLNPHYFQNPSLMIYGTAFLFWLLTEHSIAFHVMNQFFNLGIADPRGDFLQMVALRGVSATVGTLTVAAVYWTGKELLGRRAGLLGAALLAVSFLHVRNSHYGTNDVAATCLLMFSVLFAARVYTRGRVSDYLLAALLGGLATSTKYNAGVFVAALLAAHLARSLERRSTGMRAHGYLLLMSPLVALAAFLVGTPYALLDFRSFLADFRSQFDYGVEPWLGQEPKSVATAFLAALAQGFGVVPLGLAGLGVLLGARVDRSRVVLLLSAPLAYYLFMSSQRLFFARFALPALPFLALLAGYALQRMVQLCGAGDPPEARLQPSAAGSANVLHAGGDETGRRDAGSWPRIQLAFSRLPPCSGVG